MMALIATTAMAIALSFAGQSIKRLQAQAMSQKIITDELMRVVNTLLEVSRVHTTELKKLKEK